MRKIRSRSHQVGKGERKDDLREGERGTDGEMGGEKTSKVWQRKERSQA